MLGLALWIKSDGAAGQGLNADDNQILQIAFKLNKTPDEIEQTMSVYWLNRVWLYLRAEAKAPELKWAGSD